MRDRRPPHPRSPQGPFFPRAPWRRALLAGALGLLLAAPLPPQVQAGQAFTYEVLDRVDLDKATPQLTFTPALDIHKVVIRMERDDGKALTLAHGPIKAGETAVMTWDQPPGAHRYTGQLHFELEPGDDYSMSLSFAVLTGRPPTLDVPLSGVDGEAHTLQLKMNRPAGDADVTVTGVLGDVLFRHHADFKGEPAGTLLPLPWGPFEGEALKVDILATGLDGFPGAFTLSPWSYHIPHEEIEFPSGSAEIRASEAPKLDASFAEIAKAQATYGAIIDITLYIAGYTDTVGPGAQNLTLSRERARSIAKALRSRGFAGPIYYQGFGETVLAVQTEDGVDSASNRRALYVLAASPPRSRDFPGGDWTALK